MEVQPTPAGAVIALTEAQRDRLALPQTAAAAPAQSVVPSEREVRDAVEHIQRTIENRSTDLRFTVDSETGKTIVSVIDTQTREVVRQIPTEEIMQVARWIDRMHGLLVNGKA